MQINFIGVRIEKTEFYAGKNYTVVAMPAADAFSFPSKYRLLSTMPLGQVGTFIDCTVNMQGIVKSKPIIDRQTGQQRIYDDANVLLECIGYQLHQSAQQQSSIPAAVDVKK